MLVAGREWVALLGGALAVSLVFLLSWRRAGAHRGGAGGLGGESIPGALSTALLLFNHEALSGC
ncbi:hypothetical protein HSBAA_13110 [Vreelandella sulfidaeris]|uniref:Uncharacterized protein n=1 Tax=Vreelandella sulfidaeris TaxID=115553 RepID=A0A455U2G6_9GAMM|nr:hypothetical protein HSBAA_13110 [Halomonas sulfidaeris]